jgi:DNA-binding PadR family transcriptional regulator
VDELTEILKGVLEGCVLQILAHRESYGYQIVKALHQAGFTSASDGTVYPILMRLEKRKTVDVARVRSELGPPRKVYTLNAAGVRALASFWERWEFVSSRLELIREDTYEHDR